MSGDKITTSTRTIGELSGLFSDEAAYNKMDPATIAYHVEMQQMVPEGTPGGLFFGASHIQSGQVGNEYFMTKGHFHQNRNLSEYYWCMSGQGLLLLMDENRNCTVETLSSGSVHYIRGNLAHRLVNTGCKTLSVGACWPSDAGHDYDSIARDGFSIRVICKGGEPSLLEV